MKRASPTTGQPARCKRGLGGHTKVEWTVYHMNHMSIIKPLTGNTRRESIQLIFVQTECNCLLLYFACHIEIHSKAIRKKRPLSFRLSLRICFGDANASVQETAGQILLGLFTFHLLISPSKSFPSNAKGQVWSIVLVRHSGLLLYLLLSGVIFSVELVTGGCLLLFQLWKQKEYMLKGHQASLPSNGHKNKSNVQRDHTDRNGTWVPQFTVYCIYKI